MSKSYKELIKLDSFEERYRYLRLTGHVGEDTFGWDRYLNQLLYRSQRWKQTRDKAIVRDEGCDLGMPDRPIKGRVIVHHINPLTLQDIEKDTDKLYDLNNLICVSHSTHNAIHYGDESMLDILPPERTPNDTCPWKKE